ncbi:MAG: HTTM domain-containing protein [Myxococcales bacterium]|nr:HTTM domain-containing protein [Myxococcales bacterium]
MVADERSHEQPSLDRGSRWEALWGRAHAPIDPASVVVFRVLFGVLAAVGALRFLAYGWVERFFEEPRFFFKYWGFEWVEVLPRPWMHVAFGVLAVLGVLISLGLFYRVAIVAFFLLFTYVELIDVTNYLNHYYLLSVLAFWMCFMPLGQVGGVDGWLARRRAARRGAAPPVATLPAWMLWALRLQIAVVYVHAGLAKATGDWLLHAQPLDIWLHARTEVPLLGAFLDLPYVPFVFAWAGFLYDTTIPFWLSWRRTRVPAYVVLLGFHFATHLLFTIGMFPLIMTSAATIFFDPSWPRGVVAALARVRARVGGGEVEHRREAPADARPLETAPPRRPWRVVLAGALALFALVQVVAPLRAHAYGGDLLWHEQGMRWSWRVMCREKDGSVAFRVTVPGRRRELVVPPSRYLTPHQEREMSGQPDLILQLARRIAEDFRARGHAQVEVRVDAFASLNGRPLARLIDPEVDLAQVRDGIGFASWILPAPDSAPIRLARGR